MALREDELDRYARHLVLREIGGQGQRRLRAATIAIVGAGGLGAPALLYLAAAGVGRLRIIDDDHVALSNLQRQVLFTADDVGAPKTEAAAKRLRALNPGPRLELRAERLTRANAEALLSGADLALDGSDGPETRRAVNAACAALGVPLLSGAIGQWDGQLSLFDPARGAPCYACLFPEDAAPGAAPSCAEGGVAGPLPGVVGALMALEAVKTLVGAGDDLRGALLLFDGLGGSLRRIRIARRPGCPVCGDG